MTATVNTAATRELCRRLKQVVTFDPDTDQTLQSVADTLATACDVIDQDQRNVSLLERQVDGAKKRAAEAEADRFAAEEREGAIARHVALRAKQVRVAVTALDEIAHNAPKKAAAIAERALIEIGRLEEL